MKITRSTETNVFLVRAMRSHDEYRQVDAEIRQLVIELNAAGFATDSSCQGKRSPEDFSAGCHTDHAFVSFDEIPIGLKRNAWRCGLEVYNGRISVCPDYEDNQPETYIRHNLAFSERMRRFFKLH